MSTYDIDLVGMRAALEAADPNDTAKLSVANALKLLDIIEFVQGYQADLVCIDKVLDQVDAPHDPEEGVSLSSTRIRLLAGQLADATQRAEKATEDARDADQEREAWKEKTVEWRSKFDAARAPNPAAKADTRECVIHDGKCSEVGCGECDTAQPDAERPSDARDCKHVELCNTGCAWCGLGNEQIIAQLRERAEAAEDHAKLLSEEVEHVRNEHGIALIALEAAEKRVAELEEAMTEGGASFDYTESAFRAKAERIAQLEAQLSENVRLAVARGDLIRVIEQERDQLRAHLAAAQVTQDGWKQELETVKAQCERLREQLAERDEGERMPIVSCGLGVAIESAITTLNVAGCRFEAAALRREYADCVDRRVLSDAGSKGSK